jgi:hypothetical protein
MTHIPFETFLECGHRSSSHSIVLDAHPISDTITRYSLYKEDCSNLSYRFYLTSVDRPHTWPYSETNNNNLIIYMLLNASRIRYILSQINEVYEFETVILERGLTKHIWKYFMAKRIARRCRAIYARRRQAADVICRFIEKCYFDPKSAYCKRRLFKEFQQLRG